MKNKILLALFLCGVLYGGVSYAAIGSSCDAGLGTCQNTRTYACGGGYKFRDRLCLDDKSYIKCCSSSCDSGYGRCIDTNTISCSGTLTTERLCTGGNSVRCCSNRGALAGTAPVGITGDDGVCVVADGMAADDACVYPDGREGWCEVNGSNELYCALPVITGYDDVCVPGDQEGDACVYPDEREGWCTLTSDRELYCDLSVPDTVCSADGVPCVKDGASGTCVTVSGGIIACSTIIAPVGGETTTPDTTCTASGQTCTIGGAAGTCGLDASGLDYTCVASAGTPGTPATPGTPTTIGGFVTPSISNMSSARITDIVRNLLQWGLGIFGLFAVGAFVFAGFQYLTAGGNSGMIDTAKKHMVWSIVGVVVALSGIIIIQAIVGFLAAS